MHNPSQHPTALPASPGFYSLARRDLAAQRYIETATQRRAQAASERYTLALLYAASVALLLLGAALITHATNSHTAHAGLVCAACGFAALTYTMLAART